MLISVIWILHKKEIQKIDIVTYFLAIGIVTAYFDFFTYLLVGLYFPNDFFIDKRR